jgi:hypothetical protein
MVPDPAVYAAALQEAFDELLQADLSVPAAKAEKKQSAPKSTAKAKASPAKKQKAPKPKKSG